jgi:DNA-binding CsgD family transcriptional regulator
MSAGTATTRPTYHEEYRERHHPWPAADDDAADRAELAVRAVDRLIDVFDFGVLVCDAEGGVHMANQAAMAVLAARDGVALQSGRIAIADVAARRKFLAALNATAPGQAQASAPEMPAALLVPRPSRKAAYQLIARRISMGNTSAASLWTLILLDPARQSEVALRALAHVHGFTHAETRLAAFLLQGASLEETAARTGLKVSTLRTQLRALLQKTGARRQAELVALLSKVPALRGARSNRCNH